MNLSTRLVRLEGVEVVQHILRECGHDMQSRLGLQHWSRTIPLEDLQRSTLEREIYTVHKGKQAIGTFTVGTQIPSYYQNSPELYKKWATSNLQALYVNRFGVLPTWQRQGVGRWCMLTIEDLALQYDCDAVRLDAYSEHHGLLKFYQKLGYQRVGRFHVGVRYFGATDVTCFEKLCDDFADPR
jgi:GNAT superfamily N-acetyltransferase